jgi:hypothetical protein
MKKIEYFRNRSGGTPISHLYSPGFEKATRQRVTLAVVFRMFLSPSAKLLVQ